MNHQMFSFRFRLPPTYKVTVAKGQIQAGNGEALAVSSDKYAVHFSSISRFATLEEAQAALDVTVKGLGFLGVLLGYGIADFRSSAGDERAPSPLEGFGAVVLLDSDRLEIERAIQLLNARPSNSERYNRAAEMFDGSCFVQDDAVAVVLRTTGLEILSTRQPVGEDYIYAIDRLIKCLGDFDVNDPVKARLRNALGREKRESISRAVQRHVLSILPEVNVEIVRDLYAVRSNIVHGEPVDGRRVYRAASDAKTLLRFSILRGLGFSTPTVQFPNSHP